MRKHISAAALCLIITAFTGGQAGISAAQSWVPGKPAAVTPQFVQSAAAGETSASTSLTAVFPALTRAGDLLVLSASVATGLSNRITSVTDSAGNTWQRLGAYALAGHDSDGELWYTAGAQPAGQVTVHTAAATVVALRVQEFAGAGAPEAARGVSKLSRSPASGPLTPAGSGELAVGFIAGHGSAQAITVTAAGYTAEGQVTSRAAQTTSVVAGYRLLGTASQQNFTGRLATPAYWAAGIALFRPQCTGGFTVTASPAAVTLSAGHPAASTVSVAAAGCATEPVSLRVTGLPAFATATFAPAVISAGQSSVLTVSASVSTPYTVAPLTITATAGAVVHTTAVTATVTRPAAIRGAFYYPWYPEAWNQDHFPFTNYTPARGFYSTTGPTVSSHIADMRSGHIALGIASWFGQGTITDSHWPALMAGARGTSFAWAPYYEPEGFADPAPQQIADDLHYLETRYGGPDSNLATLPGRGMVVFVYNAHDLTTAIGCGTVSRWLQARQLLGQQYGQQVYIDLKVFPGYQTCPGTPQIDGWHQYGPAVPEHDFAAAPGDGSFTISPGFWKSGLVYGEPPFLARDRSGWPALVARMNASGAFWQLITTFNEWGEGTAIEGAAGCTVPAPAGVPCDWGGAYLAALRDAPPPG